MALFPIDPELFGSIDRGVSEELRSKVSRFHVASMRCSVTKTEFMMLKVLASPTASTADRIGRYAADLAAEGKKDWAELIDDAVAANATEYLAKDAVDKKKKKQQSKDEKKTDKKDKKDKKRKRDSDESAAEEPEEPEKKTPKKAMEKKEKKKKGK